LYIVLFGSLTTGKLSGVSLFFPNRVVEQRTDSPTHRSSETKLLTKGDNNAADDTELYAKGQDYLSRGDIIGSVVAYIPFVGYATIMLSEHPWLKTVMLGLMGLMVVLQRE
jgi:signal peptidase